MRYLLIVFLVLVFSGLNGQAISRMSLTLGFDSGSSELKGSALEFLKSMADTLGQEGVTINKVIIEGHTDSEGDAKENKILSEQRVISVVRFLEERGLVLNGLQTNYYGEERPVAKEEGDKDKALNRRVQLTVELEDVDPQPLFNFASEVGREEKEAPSDLEPLEGLHRRALQAFLVEGLHPQIFTIAVHESSSFKTKGGLIFSFPTAAFADHCADSVTITIQEYDDAQSMIKGNMTTTSDGRLLYSVGMYELQAYCHEGKEVVKPQKKYTVFVPYQERWGDRAPRDVYAFTGLRDSLTGIVNWQQDTYKRQDPLLGNWMCGSTQGCQLFKNIFLSKRERQAAKRVGMEREKIAQRYQNVDFTAMGKLVGNEVYYYVFESSQLGLINYDIFWKLPAEKLIDQKVELSTTITNNTEVMLYFKGRRCMVPPLEYYRDHVVFPQVPKGEEVYVVALSIQEGKKRVQLGIAAATIGSNEIVLALTEVASLEELDVALALLKP